MRERILTGRVLWALAIVGAGSMWIGSLTAAEPVAAVKPQIEVMAVEDVRPGMIGSGKTVLQGTELVPFRAEILGVMKNVAPGRDLILSRLSGADLERTGVIAGMSGSPVYIDGKLIGAVAYAWQFSKEPLAGITPFVQMRDATEKPLADGLTRTSLDASNAYPVSLVNWLRPEITLTEVAAELAPGPLTPLASGAAMQPIAIPLSASGFGPKSLAFLEQQVRPLGMLPVATGGGTADAVDADLKVTIEPGAALACGLVTGDMDLSGIGTVTHVEGDRVWGWGHPMFSSGRCQYLLRSGFIHVVNSRLSVSTKMGSPLSIQGVIDADVGSCVAGQLGSTPDLLPIEISICDASTGQTKRFRVQIVRQANLVGPLVATVLSNSIEDLGQLPADLTVGLKASIGIEGMDPIEMHDSFSGSSFGGNDGPARLFMQLAQISGTLARNPFGSARLTSIECHVELIGSRSSAAIERVRLDSDSYEPGDDVVATVRLRPYRQDPIEREIRLRLPANLPPGDYQAKVCEPSIHLRDRFNEQPYMLEARSVGDIAKAYRAQLSEPRQQLCFRMMLPGPGVSVDDIALPQLPASARSVFTTKRGADAAQIRDCLVERAAMPWNIEGSESIRFTVVEHKPYSK